MKLMPSSGRGALARFALGALIVIGFTATTTAVAGLLQFQQLASDISASPSIGHARVTVPNPGAPQTILILGSDHRAHQPQNAANSDTIILVRMDASSSTINVMSVPRDLRVQIPVGLGGSRTAKINAAYSLGGPNLVVKTLQRNVFPHLQVNHIVDINFAGFKQLVNQIGCVYTDVDHRYFNQNIGTSSTNYSSIDIPAGYQKLCGEDALAYVRYRHTDTDIVRSARQQDFIREAKDQYGQANLIANRDILLHIFGQHTQTDPNLHTTDGLINLFNLVAFADGHAIREIHFPAILEPCSSVSCFVSADPAAEARAYDALMAVVRTSTPVPATGRGGGARTRGAAAPTAGLSRDLAGAKTQAGALGNPGMPVYLPKLVPNGSSYDGPTAGEYPRAYRIRSPQNGSFPAYRVVGVVDSMLGQYYGIQGTAWQDAPILVGAGETRFLAGKRLELHFDGHKLRLVAWRTARGVYWISNTLSLNLTNQQMLGLAASLSPA